MGFARRLATFCVVVAALGAAATSADAASLVYIQGGNVFLADEDGGRPFQVTLDGTTADPQRTAYRSPSEADDGTIVAARAGELYHLRQNGAVLARFVPDTGGYPLAAAVSPDGSRAAYNFSQITQCTIFQFSCGYFPQPGAAVTSTAGRTGAGGDVGGTREQDAQWIDNATLVLGTATSNVDYDVVGQGARNWFTPGTAYPGIFAPGEFPYPEQPVASRSGGRLAVVVRPNASGGNPTAGDVLEVYKTNGAPPAAPSPLCALHTKDPGGFQRPAFAPDGSGVIWTDGLGVEQVDLPAADCTGGAQFDFSTAQAAIGGASDASFGMPANNPGPRPTVPAPTPAAAPSPSPAPAPAPAPTAAKPTPSPVTPTSVLAVQSTAAATIKRAVLSAKGLADRLTCNTTCTYSVALEAGSTTARRLGLVLKAKGAAVVLGTAHGTTGTRGTTATVRLTARARTALARRLGHGKSLTLVLHVQARATSGATAVRDRRLVVRG